MCVCACAHTVCCSSTHRWTSRNRPNHRILNLKIKSLLMVEDLVPATFTSTFNQYPLDAGQNPNCPKHAANTESGKLSWTICFCTFPRFVKTSKCATPRQECSKPTLSSSLTDMNAFVLPNDQHSIFPGSILEAPWKIMYKHEVQFHISSFFPKTEQISGFMPPKSVDDVWWLSQLEKVIKPAKLCDQRTAVEIEAKREDRRPGATGAGCKKRYKVQEALPTDPDVKLCWAMAATASLFFFLYSEDECPACTFYIPTLLRSLKNCA